jgi:urea transport system substrate-binding protein
MKDLKVKRWVLAGTDYVYPRTTNKILEAYLKAKGVANEDIMINYTPFGHSDWQSIVADIKKFGSAGKKTAVVSTINGDANVPFYKELGNQGVSAASIPVVAFSVGEEELSGIDTKPLVGHLAAWNYFMSIDAPINREFIKAIIGVEAPNLSGGTSKMLANHHITKPVLIGEIQEDGQFAIVWKTDGLVPGDAWSDFLPDSKIIEADWTEKLNCGNYNTVTKKCSGQNY